MDPQDWDEYADGWDSNADVRHYAELAFDSWSRAVAPMIPRPAESRALDFGCGTGLLAEMLATRCGHVVASDFSAKMIEVLQTKVAENDIGNITPLLTETDIAAASTLPELREPFDFVVASSVCSFLPDFTEALRNIAALLAPGGLFIQWDWLEDMPVQRIQGVYDELKLKTISIEQAFAMGSADESMPVVMGVAQLPAE